MTIDSHIDRWLARFPAIAATVYFGVVIVLGFVAWSAAADLFGAYDDTAAAREILSQLEGRQRAGGPADSAAGPARTGSPFLEGQTVTVAGAALLQRVAGAVTGVGGNVLSSQVDVQASQSKPGQVSLIASVEVTQPDLQKLLYDLEAGMPYLYVDQLVVQAPEARAGGNGRLQVMIAVSGQWQGTK